MIFIKKFKLKKKPFYVISLNFLCHYCCSINLTKQSEHSGLRPDTSSLVLICRRILSGKLAACCGWSRYRNRYIESISYWCLIGGWNMRAEIACTQSCLKLNWGNWLLISVRLSFQDYFKEICGNQKLYIIIIWPKNSLRPAKGSRHMHDLALIQAVLFSFELDRF